jgi:hypothetical protein
LEAGEPLFNDHENQMCHGGLQFHDDGTLFCAITFNAGAAGNRRQIEAGR